MISPNCHYKIFWHGGNGSNMRVEVLAMWGLLWVASQLFIENMWVYGDSKVIIDHLNKGTVLNPGTLMSWLEQIKTL